MQFIKMPCGRHITRPTAVYFHDEMDSPGLVSDLPVMTDISCALYSVSRLSADPLKQRLALGKLKYQWWWVGLSCGLSQFGPSNGRRDRRWTRRIMASHAKSFLLSERFRMKLFSPLNWKTGRAAFGVFLASKLYFLGLHSYLSYAADLWENSIGLAYWTALFRFIVTGTKFKENSRGIGYGGPNYVVAVACRPIHKEYIWPLLVRLNAST